MRRKSGTTPTKAMAMATRGCLRAILSTTADGNPCATVMPLPLAAPPTPTAATRPDNGLRVFCSAETGRWFTSGSSRLGDQHRAS